MPLPLTSKERVTLATLLALLLLGLLGKVILRDPVDAPPPRSENTGTVHR